MKKLILLIVVGYLVFNFGCCIAMAKEEEISLIATASSTYSTSSYYQAANAVDGNESTYWLGARNAAPWWIMFDAGEVKSVGFIKLIWYSSYYVPQNYDIQISNDGTSWTDIYTESQGSVNEEKEINHEARYIRIYINQATYFPVLREFKAYAKLDLPRVIRFQGTLKDSSGIPLEGYYTLTFRLYDTEIGGVPVWEEVQNSIEIEKGLFSAELGSITPLDISFDKQYWLGIEVEYDGEMTPRFKMTAVPYAIISEE